MQKNCITPLLWAEKSPHATFKKTPIIMKSLFFACLIGSAGLVQATNTYAQTTTVSLHVENQTVGDVLQQIESKTEFSFFYNNRHVDLNRRVSVSMNETNIFKILDAVFDGTDIVYQVVDNRIVLSKRNETLPLVQQSGKKITGTVLDATGMPVIGANVMVKGTTNGTITDMDGKFSLEVDNNATLVISYIGFANQEIKVGNQTSLSIAMKEDVEALDELVVVGFGTQKKVNLTGAVSTVSSEVFEDRPVQNVAMMLQGEMPGLNITKTDGTMDAAPKINIRGTTTIGEGSSGDPLILIDGMEGDMNMLNPQDIENVSVLKDAAASSIYGSRAPFGVILITTKKGKEGKFTVNYNNSFRWNTPVKRPHTVDSYRFATYFNDAAINAKATGKFTPERMQRIKDYMDGKITTVNIPDPNNPAVWADGYDYANANVDWWDVIFNQWTFSQEHTASITGGTEKLQAYASVNFLDGGGMMKLAEDTYRRYATNLRLSAQLSKIVSVNYGVRYSRSDYDRPARMGNIGALGYQTWPVLPVYDDNGYFFSSPSPALGIAEGGRDKTNKNIMTQQLGLVITPFNGLVINGDVNYSFTSDRNHWDTQKTYNHNVAGEPIQNADNTEVYEYSNTYSYINPNLYATYSHAFESGHDLKVMLGFQSEQYWNNAFSAMRNGIMVPGMDVIDITNGTDGSGKITPPSVGGSRNEWAVFGFFGRLNYSWKDRYLAEVNLRYDGTSRFRKDQRWKWFPSFSAGWNIAREQFWEDWTDYVGTLKIRGSYGSLGNQNTSSWYPTYLTMPVGTANGGWLINGVKPNTANAPGIISSTMTWETIQSLDFGVDISALKNRLNVSFGWYKRMTKDMIGPAPELPGILGTGVPKTNNTDLETLGTELTIGWKDQLKNGFSYQVAFNLSDDRTNITNYPNETYDLGQAYYTGKRLGEIWGYETIGIAKTQEEMDRHLASLPNGGQNPLGSQWEAGDIMYKDLNGDGVINDGANTLNDHGDLKVIGNNSPRFRFGLNLAAQWKGVDISAFFQGVMKRDYWEGSYNFWGYGDWIWRSVAFEEHMDYFRNDPDHIMGENLNAYYPRPVDGTNKNHQIQTRYLQNAAYMRLKNLSIGYTLPSNVMSKAGISKFRVFLSAENLWTITGLSDIFDPEQLGGGTGSIGYPLSKTVSAGINVNF